MGWKIEMQKYWGAVHFGAGIAYPDCFF